MLGHELGSDLAGVIPASQRGRPIAPPRPGRQDPVAAKKFFFCLPWSAAKKSRWKLECKHARSSPIISRPRDHCTVGVAQFGSGRAPRLLPGGGAGAFWSAHPKGQPPIAKQKNTCHPKPGDDVNAT